MIEFFMIMVPPTVTQQEHRITVRNGKPHYYDPAEIKAAKEKLESHLASHVPAEKMSGALQLCVKWCFPIQGAHYNGEYKTSRPDTDNLEKMLKDVMTKLGFWHDDAQVASEVAEKFWAKVPGIYIGIRELEKGAAHDVV